MRMKKILIIEDQEMLREEVKDWFEFEGYITYTASNGKEGVDLAVKHFPDLILCDIMMPEMDGNAVLEVLRHDIKTSMIPFIFMTALSERVQVRAGMDQGADDYITKPFTHDELMNAVHARLEKIDLLTERSQAALQELRINLITSLPHELNTLLNGMLGFGQLLKNYPDSFTPEELPEIGNRIYTSALRLHRLIQNYLLYAQLELKKTGLSRRFELQEPMEIITRVSTKMADDSLRSGDLILDCRQCSVFIAELEFTKVVEEIAGNAFKFSSPGTPVKICCYCSEDMFHMIFEDKGCGIKEEDLKKIGAFMQFDRMLKEQQGFGLGLIISKRITELFNGSMKIDSQVGRGTTIRISWPGKN